jgi:hypothetical protein
MDRRRIRFVLAGLLAAAVAVAVSVTATAASATTDPAGPARPGARKHVCYQGKVQGIGWQEWVCDGDMAGTTGQSRRLEAIRFKGWGEPAGVCATAYVDPGWQNLRCGFEGEVFDVGSPNQSLPIWGLRLDMPRSGLRSLCFHRACGLLRLATARRMRPIFNKAVSVAPASRPMSFRHQARLRG